nr:hypothetical protein B0A51_04665 [Rachicladosporium sp. CCFEE 5018]
MAPSPFQVLPASEADFPALTSLIVYSFKGHPTELLNTGDPLVPGVLEAATARHLHACRDHASKFPGPVMLKCVHTDPTTGEQEILAAAEWFIYSRERSREEYEKIHCLLSAEWVEDHAGREKLLKLRRPVHEQRVHWMAGKPYGLLMYLCVAPKWRKQGVGTMCVQRGLDRCRELGIPAYLEASSEGVPVYQKLGFEEMGVLRRTSWDDEEEEMPVMICWPEGTKDEAKRPAGR